MYSVKTIANYFISHRKRIPNLSPMKLQKLIYYAHAASLAFRNKPLIKEYFEVWKLGPVVPELYHELKHLGRDNIEGLVTDFAPVAKMFAGGEELIAPIISENDNDTEELLESTIRSFGSYSAFQLSHLTHSDNGAWFHTLHCKKNNIIDDEDIKKCFSSYGV